MRWLLDEDDAAAGRIARFDLSRWEKRLWLFTATPERMDAAQGRAHDLLGGSLGPRLFRQVDDPDVVPRWQRERIEPMLASSRAIAAAIARERSSRVAPRRPREPASAGEHGGRARRRGRESAPRAQPSSARMP